MLLDVFDQVVEVVRVRKWRLAKERVQAKLQVVLDVSDVVLLHVRIGWLANEHSGVLVRTGALLWSWCVLHQLIDVWHLHLLERAGQHFVHVELVGVLVCQLDHSLHLSHTLGLREDVWIRNRDHVRVACEVFAVDLKVGHNFRLAHVVEVPAVQAAKDLQHT